MFGYVRPDASELKVKEFERFRALYCGLCHELGREYGVVGRVILNYDFVFLAMLLWSDGGCGYETRRCVPGLCRKKCVCASAPSLETAAGCSVILSYMKAVDGVADSHGAAKLGSWLVRAFLRRPYKKASVKYPEFERQVRERLEALGKLEREGAASLDRPADEFARLLSAAAFTADGASRRALEQVLYHVGRIVYIADGFYDLRDDLRRGNYNPVAARFGLSSADVPEEIKTSVLETMMSSARLAAAAFELTERNYWTPVAENIVYLGIPDMIRRVVDGTYVTVKRGLPKSAVSGAEGRIKG